MKFKVLSVNEFNDKAFVFTKCLDKDENFFISETSLLGGFELVEYLDQPRSIDENGQQCSDRFVFQLKHKSDNAYINTADIVELTDNYALIIEKTWTVSGKMVVGLEYSAGSLPIGTILESNDKRWKSVNDPVTLNFRKLSVEPEVRERAIHKNWKFYRIDPIGHDEFPLIGAVVKIIKPVK